MRDNTKNEITSTIANIRTIEDAIRASKKYTEGLQTIRKVHPIQGEEYASRVFCKHYEVYPQVTVTWDMPVGVAMDWLWKDVECLYITFRYDYRSNIGTMICRDAEKDIARLSDTIIGVAEAIKTIMQCNKHPREIRIVQPIASRRSVLRQAKVNT